jgi:hypothetical protein
MTPHRRRTPCHRRRSTRSPRSDLVTRATSLRKIRSYRFQSSIYSLRLRLTGTHVV